MKKISQHSKRVRFCLLGASFNTNNMGVSALTTSMIKCITEHFPDARITLLDYGKKRLTHNCKINDLNTSVDLLNIRFSKKIYLKNNIAVLILISLLHKFTPFEKIRKKIFYKNYYLSHISEADVVTSIAGGDSFTDLYGLGRFFYVALPQLFVLFMGKDLILLPQTIGPFNKTISRLIARYILKKAAIVYSRDYTGFDEVKNLLGYNLDTSKFRFCYDLGLILDPAEPLRMDLCGLLDKKQKDSTIVGLNVSGLLYIGGYTQDDMFRLGIDYPVFIRELIDRLITKLNVTVLLVPHFFGDGRGADSRVCLDIYEELADRYENKLFTVRGNYDHCEIKYIIGLCDFFIGSRMHACIAAVSQTIPAVSISYSKKFFGVMQTLGVESLVADPQKNTKEELLHIIDESFDRRDKTKAHLKKKIPQVREKVLGLFKDLNIPS